VDADTIVPARRIRFAALETALNQWEHYASCSTTCRSTTSTPGANAERLPLVLTHGWPWTFWDFHA
jgi:hypothetical protein